MQSIAYCSFFLSSHSLSCKYFSVDSVDTSNIFTTIVWSIVLEILDQYYSNKESFQHLYKVVGHIKYHFIDALSMGITRLILNNHFDKSHIFLSNSFPYILPILLCLSQTSHPSPRKNLEVWKNKFLKSWKARAGIRCLYSLSILQSCTYVIHDIYS